MALVHSFEKSGNILFKYRGQIPIVLFLAAVPVMFFTDYSFLKHETWLYYSLFIFSIIVSFLGQYIRAVAIGTSNKFTSGRNLNKQEAAVLNTTGIYSTCRHPLYLGNYFMWIGIVIFTFNIWFFVLVSLAFWLYYERIMFAEERFLERKFGEEYISWSLKVPAFVPSRKNYIKNDIPFSFKTILRREYPGVTATIIGFVFVDFFRQWFILGELKMNWNWVIILFIGLMISLVLRTLKHQTNVLNEEDRS